MILTLNPELEALLTQRFCISSERVEQLPTGVDTELFKPQAPYHDRTKVVWFGKTDSKNKGADIAYKLREDFPECEFVFPVEDNPLAYHEIPEIYSDAGILISASRSETQGLAVMEAAAAGMAVLQSYFLRKQGDKEVQIQPWFVGPGYSVFKRDYDNFAKALKHLLENPELVEEMGDANRKWIEEFYSLKTMANQYHDLMKKAGSMSKPRPFVVEDCKPTTPSRRGGNSDYVGY